MTLKVRWGIVAIMQIALHNAVSGLKAAARRLEVSADNVVNSRSDGYLPHRVDLVANALGGTRATAVPVTPPSVPFFDPDSPLADADGVAPRPNVSLEGEIVEQMLARHAFEANLRTVETADRMMRSLLDTFA